MIKDFVPARTSLASGIVIKQHILERNKYPQPKVNNHSTIAHYKSNPYNTPIIVQDISVSGTVAPQWNNYEPGTIENFSGGTGGTFEQFNGVNTSPYGPNGIGPENIYFITQSWAETINTTLGQVITIHDAQDEFYDGEFSGSVILVTTQSLAQPVPLNLQSLSYNVSGSSILFNSLQSVPPVGRINWQGSTYISSSYVSYFYINETSLNGINISTALSNLESGNKIIFSVSGSVDDGPFQGQPFETTIEGTIVATNETSPSIWRIDLSTDPNLLATVYNIQYPDLFVLYPELYPSSSTSLIPFLNDISNYYNSDYNPLINNILVDRLSTIYQDVDYSTGIYTPTNFGLLISGSAPPAAVQDSNYTSKRVINPRYNGVKSTSQHLNYWTPGDTGTYGKIPTIDSLKTMVAYCDWIGGWPPDRENASAIHVLYLIKSDGSVIIPNTSQNSLADIKGTFESGENILISPKTISAGQPQLSRKIIRGGTRIEPILYTQYGQAPNVSWNTTMSFADIIPSPNGSVGNYSALYGKTGAAQTLTYGTPQQVTINQTIYGTSVTSNSYTIPLNAVQDGVQLNIDANIRIRLLNPNSSGNPYSYQVTLYIYKNSTVISDFPYTAVNIYPNSEEYIEFSNTSPITLTSGDYNTGDTISAYIKVDNYEEYPGGAQIFNANTFLKISQYPAYTLPVTSSGANSIWNWPNSSSYPYVITSSQATLVNLFNDPNVKMVDISGSGFNPVTLPWSIKYGDEFRFEGREDFVYQVGKIFGPADSGSGRLFQTGSIEVHFNANLPTSASTSVFNLDHFVIRRYVDDASQILMEGFRPTNSSGPYIVRPEYIVPELDKSVDQFILDLTQKGLIT
jgi:hypothetical protein